MYEDCWLPDLCPCEDLSNWKEYEDYLYEIFTADFIDSQPMFMGKPVRIRRHPLTFGREEAFHHVTCCDYLKDGDRQPDMRRCERIRWIRAFIENYRCDGWECPSCNGVRIWSTIYPKTKCPRFKILLEDERYMVIVEERPNYCLLISAYHIDYDSRLRKLMREYEKEAIKTGSAPIGTQPGTPSYTR